VSPGCIHRRRARPAKRAASDRVADTWYDWTSFSFEVNVTAGQTHQVAVYALDYDPGTRAEIIDILDAS